MPKQYRVLFILIALILSACSQNEGITYTAPELEDGWSIKMTLSGGIAGLLRNITVQSDGNFAVRDEVMKNTAKGKLTQDELARLTELVSSLEFNPPDTPSGCADCFEYVIEIESGGRKMLIEADDVTLGESGMGEVTQFLRGVMDAALK